jgi:prepilin-type N-terminal cleavage/methylation domain-containing protein
MRAGFNLIELIFTIVIMAGIFAVLPKIIFVTNKSDTFALKQEALFNTISLTNIASLLAWDENNTKTLSILQTSGDNFFDCNETTSLRNGNFSGANSRKCKESFSASAIGADGESDYLSFNDIDDFNGTSIDVNLSSFAKYKIYTEVSYLDDSNFTTVGDKMTIVLGSSVNKTTNIKKFKATVGYAGKRDKNISSFYYYSTNIGQITLDSETW